MKFVDGIIKAYEKKWSYINTFKVEFQIPDKLKSKSGWSDLTDGREINVHIINIDTPQFTNEPVEAFIANKWVVHNGKDMLYRFSITFRDHDQMDLYRKFTKMYNETRRHYFEDIKMTVLLYKEDDYYSESEKLLFEFQDTLIESVSQVQFSNATENQIGEFTVQFKCVKPFII